MPARIITLEDYPSNVEIFTASSMKEAVLKAERAFEEEGIQGAIWHPESSSFDWERDRALKAGFNGIFSSYKLASQFQYLDKSRQKNFKTLSKIFNKVELEIRHKTAGKGIMGAHYDGTTANILNQEYRSQQFSGAYRIRIIQTLNGPGTWVYEDGAAINPWEVGTGDYLFMMGVEDGDKAIFHSEPWFQIEEGSVPRVLDVYDMICK